MSQATPYDFIQEATRRHRRDHGCWAYTFEDGAGLIMLAAGYRPARVLELGTALGFTACCLASAFHGASVDTIEGDPLHVALARENIGRAGLSDRITVHHGQFEAVLPALQSSYDFVFFDGFSPGLTIIRHVRDMLRDAGHLACANIPFTGERDKHALDIEFADRDRWLRAGAIENGATQVYRKVSGTRYNVKP